MTTENTTDPLKVGTLVKLLNSGYRRAKVTIPRPGAEDSQRQIGRVTVAIA